MLVLGAAVNGRGLTELLVAPISSLAPAPAEKGAIELDAREKGLAGMNLARRAWVKTGELVKIELPTVRLVLAERPIAESRFASGRVSKDFAKRVRAAMIEGIKAGRVAQNVMPSDPDLRSRMTPVAIAPSRAASSRTGPSQAGTPLGAPSSDSGSSSSGSSSSGASPAQVPERDASLSESRRTRLELGKNAAGRLLAAGTAGIFGVRPAPSGTEKPPAGSRPAADLSGSKQAAPRGRHEQER